MSEPFPLLDAVVIAPKAHHKSSVIWLHGLGADGHGFAEIVPELQLPDELGVRFVFPHAPIRPITLNNGFEMRAWFDIYGLKADSKFDEVGIQKAYLSISSLIEREAALGIPINKIILAGFSQGGALALYAGLQYPQQLGGILGLSTFLPLTDVKKNLHHTSIPIFMVHGTADTIVPLEFGEISKNTLLALGYSVKWQTYDMPHTVCAQETKAISMWLKSVLK